MGFATKCVAKLAFVETNALVRGVWFIAMPVTIRGRIAVQPVRGIVRRFSYCLVKSYPAIPTAIHSRLTLQTWIRPIQTMLGLNCSWSNEVCSL